MIARVPETGASLIANIPRLEAVSEIVRYQNKNFDGTGIPADKTSGEGDTDGRSNSSSID